MTYARSQRAIGFATFILAIVLTVLGGCATSGETSPDDSTSLIKQPTSAENAVEPKPDGGTAVGSQPDWLRVDVLTFPLATDLTEAWKLVSAEKLDAGMVQLWRENGMFVGIIDEATREGFLGALPAVVNHRAQAQTLSTDWARLYAGPPIRRPLDVTLVDQTGIESSLQLDQGRCQFLVRVKKEDGGDAMMLEVVPHHHFIRPSIQVRTPQELALDGRVFNELALGTPLAAGKVTWLAVALNPPPPPPAPAKTEEVVTAPENTGDEPPKADEADSPAPLVYRLGWPLLTGERYHKTLQVVLLISLRAS